MIETAVAFLESVTALRPRHAVVLGSGLGAFAESLEQAIAIPYSEIPGWPESTAIGHAGKLHIGVLNGLPLAVLGVGACAAAIADGAWTGAPPRPSSRVILQLSA